MPQLVAFQQSTTSVVELHGNPQPRTGVWAGVIAVVGVLVGAGPAEATPGSATPDKSRTELKPYNHGDFGALIPHRIADRAAPARRKATTPCRPTGCGRTFPLPRVASESQESASGVPPRWIVRW